MSEAKIAKTDATLLGCIVVGAGHHHAGLSKRAQPWRVTPPTAKSGHAWLGRVRDRHPHQGPGDRAGPRRSVIAVSIADRDWRWLFKLHALPGFALVLLLVVPGPSRSGSRPTAN